MGALLTKTPSVEDSVFSVLRDLPATNESC